MLANKHTRNARSFSNPCNHAARRVPAQDSLARTPLWLTIMKVFLSGDGHRDPKQANGNDSGQLALDYPANEGWQSQEEIKAWANHHHVLSPMGFKCQKQNPPNPPKKDSPVPCMPCKQTPCQPTPGPSGTQWSEDLSRNPPSTMRYLFLARVHPLNHLRTFPLVSQSLRWLQRKPQRNLLVSHHFSFFTPINFSLPLLQAPPARPTTPRSVIIINDTPIQSPPPSTTTPVPSSPHSHNGACHKYTDLRPTLMIP
ncbi:hypothetical protein O181_073508 [Austropuccinia psidii MF-1]|uniref:Uncharacterized protein n=1 Tax=Austropuccinia psidii MF-1 TaxID=1389203 RepID=A0A9Q3F558_9BASI|nr:hypothetical protein [Austropuccinia psidii MF-1]